MARRQPESEIYLVDNQWRRTLVKSVGSNSISPILSLKERFQKLKLIHPLAYLHEFDITTPELDKLIKEVRPDIVFHAAQQASAHYAMRGVKESIETIRNNEEGNMRLLWALKHFAPECHLLKLGSFGEYSTGNLPVAEGYYIPSYNGVLSDNPVPYPRESDDVYHITKINDTNFISMACRKWGLKVTDIMQATIFGFYTDETDESLITRFDYDEFFGTVLNRFVAQAVTGIPLSVYGSGHQRTGLMSLVDAVDSLVTLATEKIERGQHKVVNHVVEKDFSIIELATTVQQYCIKLGIETSIDNGTYDPRSENLQKKKSYNIETSHLQKVRHHGLFDVIEHALATIRKYEKRINQGIIAPSFSWKKS